MSKTEGLIRAHHILVDYSRELTAQSLRWWQLGRWRCAQMEALCELSERLYAEITERSEP